MWAAEVHNVTLARYANHDDAWKILRRSIPASVLDEVGPVTLEGFREDYDYTPDPLGGWIFAWWSEPLWWVGEPRPDGFQFRPTG